MEFRKSLLFILCTLLAAHQATHPMQAVATQGATHLLNKLQTISSKLSYSDKALICVFSAYATAGALVLYQQRKYAERNRLYQKINDGDALTTAEIQRAITEVIKELKTDYLLNNSLNHPQLRDNTQIIDALLQRLLDTKAGMVWGIQNTSKKTIKKIIDNHPDFVSKYIPILLKKKSFASNVMHLNDYTFVAHLKSTSCNQDMRMKIATKASLNKAYFPLTYAQFSTSEIQKAVSQLTTKDLPNLITEIDTLITDYPACKEHIRILCLTTQKAFSASGAYSNNFCCSKCEGSSNITHIDFFKDILLERYRNNKPIAVTQEEAKILGCPDLATYTHKQLKNKLNELIHTNEFAHSATNKYLQRNRKHMIKNYNTSLHSSCLKRLSDELIAIEHLESERGQYTFVHGEPKQMHLYQYWFTKLYEAKHKVTVDDYLFLRFEKTHIVNQFFHYLNNKKSHQSGSRWDIFMSHTLYSGRDGANPGKYYLKNHAAFGYNNSIKNIFNHFGYASLYETFKDEILALEKEYISLCPRGQIILFSFSEQALQKSVYAARPGGAKRSVGIKDPITGTVKYTKNMVKIAQALKNNPKTIKDYDNIEYCFIPSLGYGLHPNAAGKDIRIFNLTGADPEKMKAYTQKEHALSEKIKAAIKEQNIFSHINAVISYHTPQILQRGACI